ncbi:MAG: PHB depolymerase family esterase [Myxococcaceae bacterium]
MSWDLDHHEGLPYRFVLPPGYDPRNRYPLVVYLHGSAERGDDTWSHLRNGVDRLEGKPLIAVAPQCPRDDTFGGSWYGGDSRTQQKVLSLVRALGQRQSVDPKRVSLIGFSMGAIGLWSMLERARSLFSAAVPIAGDLDWETAKPLADFPIWAFHGADDRLVRPDATRTLARWMAQNGGVLRYTELPGVGHDSWRAAFDTAGLLSWLLAQRAV